MFSIMQDPQVANRLAQLYTEERIRFAAGYHLARTAQTTDQSPAPVPVSHRRRGWKLPAALRPSFR
jgi:hypothetical protein